MIWIDDKTGFKVYYRSFFRKVWIELSDKERSMFDEQWKKMYNAFCNRLKQK